VIRTELPLHPGTSLYTGTVTSGPHGGPRSVYVAVTAEGVILPLGCRTTRVVLRTLRPPVIADSTLPQYAALLAMLEGNLPWLGEPIVDPNKVPDWAKKQAIARNFALPAASIEGNNAAYERGVSVMVLVRKTLYLVSVRVARVGGHRFMDRVQAVHVLASRDS